MFGVSAFGAASTTFKDPNTNNSFELPNPPNDTISALAWSPTANHLAASSWDNSVRVWEVNHGVTITATPKLCYNHDAPVLCVAFSKDGQSVFSGGCDNKVKMKHLVSQQEQVVGQHDAPIKHVFFVGEINMIVSGSWDKTVRFWTGQAATAAVTLQLPERVYAMDIKYPLMVVGMAERHIDVYNLDNIAKGITTPYKRTQTALKLQTRVLSCWIDKLGYTLGSIEGRCSIAYIDEPPKPPMGQPLSAKKTENFAFKCHRTPASGGQDGLIYSVNAIDIHPVFGTFCTCGGDGMIIFWDKENRARLKAFNSCHYPVTAAKFNTPGDLFAYAVGYDWSKGHETNAPNYPKKVYVHKLQEADIKPKRDDKKDDDKRIGARRR